MLKEAPKIVIIIGTKAELIKCFPVMKELEKQKKEYYFIHTGQHPVKKACKEFGVKEPDCILSKEPEISTKFWSKINRNSFFWFFYMIIKIRRKLRELRPSCVIYHGDTMSTAAASIGSSSIFNIGKKTWWNFHLEAGLRSGSIFEPFPEEISRLISSRYSDVLLAVSDLTEKVLRKNYRGKKIIKVGNTIIDSALISYNSRKKKNYKGEKNFVLINVHRHENLRNRERLERVIRIIESVKIKAIWPLHDNTKKYLEEYGFMTRLLKMKNLKIISLTDYADFISLMANCKYLIADGGSIQEESLVFKKPCIILRKKTERWEGLSTGINFLTGLSVGRTKKIIYDLENGGFKVKNFKNPYGEKGVSKKIVDMLM